MKVIHPGIDRVKCFLALWIKQGMKASMGAL